MSNKKYHGLNSDFAQRALNQKAVFDAFYRTVHVMKSARNHKTSMPIDDIKVAEDVMLFLENIRNWHTAQTDPLYSIDTEIGVTKENGTMWIIDQMVRILSSGPIGYRMFRINNPNWDEGIMPGYIAKK